MLWIAEEIRLGSRNLKQLPRANRSSKRSTALLGAEGEGTATAALGRVTFSPSTRSPSSIVQLYTGL